MPLSAQRFAGNATLNSCVDAGYRITAGETDHTAVSIIQTALGDLGYKCAQDGIFGPDTGDMVVAFKNDEGLTPNDAVVSTHTMEHLDAYYDWEPADPDAPDPSTAGLTGLAFAAMATAQAWITAAIASLTAWPSAETHPEDPAWTDREEMLTRHFGIDETSPPDRRTSVIDDAVVPILNGASRAMTAPTPFITIDAVDRSTLLQRFPGAYMPGHYAPGARFTVTPAFRNAWTDVDRAGALLRVAVAASAPQTRILALPVSPRYALLTNDLRPDNRMAYVCFAYEAASGSGAAFRPNPVWY